MDKNQNNMIRGRMPTQISAALWGAFLCGLLAHAMTFFNKYSIYEDISQLFGVGATYTSGRWMLDILHRLEVSLLGGSYSLPLLNGLLSVFYIAVSAGLLVTLLEIKKPLFAFLVGGAMVTTPSLAGLFGYMFTAPHYMFGLLLTVAGCYILCKWQKWYVFLSGSLLIACGVGIYQANIAIALSVLLLYFIHTVATAETVTWSKYLQKVAYFVAACLCFMVLYVAINKLYLLAMDAELSDYQGINEAGMLPLTTYIRRGLYAFKMMFLPNAAGSDFMYPFGMIWLYRGMLLLVAVLLVCLLCVQGKRGFSRMIQITLPIAVLPFAINFIYVMCEADHVHSLMVYSHTLSFVFAIWLVSILWPHKNRLFRVACAATCCGCLLFSALYIRVDNICYLKAEIVQQQCISYFTSMRTRIQSTPGYRDDMPVTYVGFYSKDTDASLMETPFPEELFIIPYHDTDSMLNGFAARSFVENWTGFAPEMRYAFGDRPEVQEMPCYPDEGSIKIIDDVLVIKFG